MFVYIVITLDSYCYATSQDISTNNQIWDVEYKSLKQMGKSFYSFEFNQSGFMNICIMKGCKANK